MATAPINITTIKSFFTSFNNNYTVDNLVRTDLGTDSFLNLQGDLNTTFAMCSQMRDFDFTILPQEISDDMIQTLSKIQQVFADIGAYFSPNETAKKDIIKRFNDGFKNLLTHYTRVVSLKELNKNEIEIDKIKESLLIAQGEVQGIARDAKKKIDVALQSVIETNQKLGIERYSESFNNEAKSFQTSSVIWLGFAILAFIAILWFAASILSNNLSTLRNEIFNQPKDVDVSLVFYYIIQQSVTKLLIASALFYALSVCVKNYRANKHNQTINKHRKTALDTFQAFSESTSDLQTKNAVLLEATHSIFGHQTSGFMSNEKDSEMSSKLIEIIKPIKADV